MKGRSSDGAVYHRAYQNTGRSHTGPPRYQGAPDHSYGVQVTMLYVDAVVEGKPM
eukprot:SAG11_NODE_36853_length_259_cov_1.293750_1_plen_54_part_01